MTSSFSIPSQKLNQAVLSYLIKYVNRDNQVCWRENNKYVVVLEWNQVCSWWRHQMEAFSALLALCAGNSPVPVNSPHKGQWRGALMFSLICVWINDWVNNREAGDLRRHRGHYDVIVMCRFRVSSNLKPLTKKITVHHVTELLSSGAIALTAHISAENWSKTIWS